MAWCTDHGLPHSALLAWSPEDRSKLVAELMERGSRCKGCGTAPWEWDADQGGSPHAYEPEFYTCPGCYRREVLKQEPNAPAGATIVLTPKRVWDHRRSLEKAARAKR